MRKYPTNFMSGHTTSIFLPCVPLTPNFNIQEWRTYSCLGLFFQNGHVVGIRYQNFNHVEDKWDQGFYFSLPNFVILKVWQFFWRNRKIIEFMLESCKFPKNSQFFSKKNKKCWKKTKWDIVQNNYKCNIKSTWAHMLNIGTSW
jgi:hypothetical protein